MITVMPTAATTKLSDHRRAKARFDTDSLFRGILRSCAAIFVIIILGLLIELLIASWPALVHQGPAFFIRDDWNPVTHEYGALSSIYGTLVSTIIALIIALPLSLGIALFLVEFAPPSIARVIGAAIELLAAVPSIIYGMWGLFVFSPFMADHVQPKLADWFGFLPFFKGPPMGIGLITAGVILGFMILPFVSSVTRDVFLMVPPVLKESAHGMGATTWEVTNRITLRYGIQGLMGAVFLGLSRALGETMAVTFVIGNDHSLSSSLFAGGNSIASTLANEFSEAADPHYLSALMALGLTLFLITVSTQIVSQMWLKRVQRNLGRKA